MRDEAQAAAHAQEIHHANLAARIARLLPLRHGRGLLERVDALFHQQREERRREALPHRPALELRVLGDARHVALTDDAALVQDDKGRGERRRIGERGVDSRVDLCAIERGRRRRSIRSPIGHGWLIASGSVVFTATGLKEICDPWRSGRWMMQP